MLSETSEKMKRPPFRLFILGSLCIWATSVVAERAEGAEPTRLTFIVYFAPEPAKDPEAVMQDLLAKTFAGAFSEGKQPDVKPKLDHHWFPTKEFPPPSVDSVRYRSRDTIDAAAMDGLSKSERAYLLEITAAGNLIAANHQACELVAAFANVTRGYPWDDECRMLYTPDSWRKRRVESWQGEIPDVRGEINMHSYRDPDLVRLITLGMRKFGLPDLVIENVPSGESDDAGNAINACAQLLIEGGKPEGGRMEIKLAAIEHQRVRAGLDAECFKTAARTITTRFRVATAERGDPENRLWRLEFPDMRRDNATENAMAAFHELFGVDNPLKFPSDKDAMRAASERARTAFFGKVAQFRKGLEPNERLIVKAPFKVPEGNEYMWMEVVGWKDNAIEGVLQNDSPYDESLRAGKRVTIPFDRIYDYVHYLPDGTEEGNETGKVLEAQEKGRR